MQYRCRVTEVEFYKGVEVVICTSDTSTVAIRCENTFRSKVNDHVFVEYNLYSKERPLQGTITAVENRLQEEKEMQNHMVELLLENFYTIGIRFNNSAKVYTYKVAKDIELLADEDQVIVATTSGFEIVNVTRVDEGMNIDLSSDIKYKFIVQKLDRTQYDELCDKDKNVAGVIAKGAAEAKRKELVEAFTGALDDTQVKLLEDVGVTGVKRL